MQTLLKTHKKVEQRATQRAKMQVELADVQFEQYKTGNCVDCFAAHGSGSEKNATHGPKNEE